MEAHILLLSTAAPLVGQAVLGASLQSAPYHGCSVEGVSVFHR